MENSSNQSVDTITKDMSKATITPTTEEERFSQTIEELIKLVQDLTIEVTKKGYKIVDPQVIGVAANVIKIFPTNKLLEVFIRRSNDHWEKIRVKNKDFFIDEAHNMFSDLPGGHVSAFKDLVSIRDKDNNPVVSSDDIDALFEFFHAMIKISIKYIHKQRQPIVVKQADGTLYKYNVPSNFEYVQLDTHAKNWGITLLFQ